MSRDCLFCSPVSDPVVLENDAAFMIHDSFPTTTLHSLIIPKRHVAAYFDLTEQEIVCCSELLGEARQAIMSQDATVTGFNIGINVGKDAGQSVMHCHIHLIPRRAGDVENPQGGIRHVIPGKGHYSKPPKD